MNRPAWNTLNLNSLLMTTALACGIVFAVAMAGCDTSVTDADIEGQIQKVEQEEAQLEAMKERQKYESEMKTKLAQLKEKVATLDEQADKATGDEQIELRGEIAKLKTKCEQMQDQLDELKAASGDVWAKTKIKAEETWQDVSMSVESKVTEWKSKIKNMINEETDRNDDSSE